MQIGVVRRMSRRRYERGARGREKFRVVDVIQGIPVLGCGVAVFMWLRPSGLISATVMFVGLVDVLCCVGIADTLSVELTSL